MTLDNDDLIKIRQIVEEVVTVKISESEVRMEAKLTTRFDEKLTVSSIK